MSEEAVRLRGGEGRFQGDDLSASMEARSASAEAEDASAEAERFDRGSSDRTWSAAYITQP
ncbi:hypothetical protein EV714DRAFT_277184 [Schizophyllum commune]